MGTGGWDSIAWAWGKMGGGEDPRRPSTVQVTCCGRQERSQRAACGPWKLELTIWKEENERVQAVSPPPWHAHLLCAWCSAIPHKAHGPITVILLTWQCLSALANFDKCNAKLSSVQPPQAILIKEGTGRSLGYFLQPGKNNHTSDFFKWPHSWVFFFLFFPNLQSNSQMGIHRVLCKKLSPGGLILICTLSKSWNTK